MLLHEQMLPSLIKARDKFLKPGGRVYPALGTLFALPFSDPTLFSSTASKVAFWEATDFYGLNLTSLLPQAALDHHCQPVVGYVDPATLLAPQSSACGWTVDFESDPASALTRVELPLSFVVGRTALLHGLALWFDVAFMGSMSRVILSTAPGAEGTHWYQARLLLREPLAVNAGQRVEGSLVCTANDRFSYDCVLRLTLPDSRVGGAPVLRKLAVSLIDQAFTG